MSGDIVNGFLFKHQPPHFQSSFSSQIPQDFLQPQPLYADVQRMSCRFHFPGCLGGFHVLSIGEKFLMFQDAPEHEGIRILYPVFICFLRLHTE